MINSLLSLLISPYSNLSNVEEPSNFVLPKTLSRVTSTIASHRCVLKLERSSESPPLVPIYPHATASVTLSCLSKT